MIILFLSGLQKWNNLAQYPSIVFQDLVIDYFYKICVNAESNYKKCGTQKHQPLQQKQLKNYELWNCDDALILATKDALE